ncbi:hypothetical protein EON79_00690 [bacterium]|nr:MAG: hypothetical protein EON79_00690 [bacterium]
MSSILQAAIVSSLLTTACTSPDAVSAAEQGQKKKPGVAKKIVKDGLTPPTTDLVPMRDPAENAFSMSMPKGWDNRIYSARVFDIHSMVMSTVSPNGSVVIFSGDPGVPQYWNPAAATPVHHDMARVHPRMKIEPFVPAEQYFPSYVQRKFGRLPDFKLVSTEADTAGADKLRKQFANAGVNMMPTMANVEFTYTDEGRPMKGLIMGTCTDSGPFWMVNASGIATSGSGDPKAYLPMFEAISRTHKMNPEWQAAQAQKHRERMAQMEAFGRQMTAQHNQNMAAIQASAQRHQQRMQTIWAQGDASVKNFYDRMAAGDVQQRNFLNYINDENTVVGSGGKTYQVDNSYQRYFMHKQNRTYVGGDSTMDIDKLRSLGLNPSDYEEVKIKG